MGRRDLLTTGCLLVALIAGCGGGDSDEDVALQTWDDYFTALLEGDGESACDQLTGNAEREAVESLTELVPEVQASDPLVECPGLMERVTEEFGPDEIAEVEALLDDDEFVNSVEINGDSATVTAANPAGALGVRLSKSGDDWLISSFHHPLGP